VPESYAAVVTALQMFSPRTLADDQAIADWLDLLTYTSADEPGMAAQYAASARLDQRDRLGDIMAPCLVLGFSDDLVTPAFAGREVASLIAGCEYVELDGCGHLGLLERPDDINRILLNFFGRH
jgi:pimeloyl-ACP methyl ester carboxylesterase